MFQESVQVQTSRSSLDLFFYRLPPQIQTVTKKEEVIEAEVNSTLDDFITNATKAPAVFVVKKTLQFKSGMNVLGMINAAVSMHDSTHWGYSSRWSFL